MSVRDIFVERCHQRRSREIFVDNERIISKLRQERHILEIASEDVVTDGAWWDGGLQ
jgi:hypothetical protein